VFRGLKQLAWLVYKLNRREIWLGGRTRYANDKSYGDIEAPNWPNGLAIPFSKKPDIFWTLSPEVELSGHLVRVVVWSKLQSRRNPMTEIFNEHHVCVFVDNEIRHPGGTYREVSFPWRWASRLAKQERWEGGQTGPVDVRDLLIEDAHKRLRGVRARHLRLTGPVIPEDDEHHQAAIQEVEETLSVLGTTDLTPGG
jgi:hypothetical protein